ncbi:hypothetical protein DFH06DRAFT_1326291 [Mycena polygramma]|nr:hypothetical protein DFH06DRAFT_1326291 [Mycena polygramma]
MPGLHRTGIVTLAPFLTSTLALPLFTPLSVNSQTDSVSCMPAPEWTLELVKSRMSTGRRITSCVIDIGDDTMVKYGEALPEEGQATQFVANSTSVRIPKIYAILHDEATTVTYLVQEKLPGTPLKDLLPQLDETARVTIAVELRTILGQLAALDEAGELGLFGRPFEFGDLFFPNFDYYCPSGKIKTTEAFVRWIPLRMKAVHNIEKEPNILIVDGHVSGIIDWAYAGWYPYFWNYYIGIRRRMQPAFRDGKWEAMLGIMMDEYPDEFDTFDDLTANANSWL